MAQQNQTQEIPSHLKKYVINQDYSRYTPEDQAVWRYIMRQLKDYLSKHAHECYVEGLTKTGISVEQIPHINDMDKKLQEFGWRAAPVSGFIPPAAFMEFQARGILPIASDMRTVSHLLYTPAPDIVHEAAGHAPILIDEKFAGYLRKYADIASHAIISKEDMDQYEAIRKLSDLKEAPLSTKEQIEEAERDLDQVNQKMKYTSEAAWLSRMNWWTAEYGLIGDIDAPRIFGAGLLSSVGESRECLSSKVKKIPLDVNCVNYGYDITEPQPQLFVTPDFETLYDVLDELADKLAYRRGGLYGLNRAIEAATVNTVELDSGLQISGILQSYLSSGEDSDESVTFLKFSGPCQLSVEREERPSHGPDYHAQGYSTPLGNLKGAQKPLSEFSEDELKKIGLSEGQSAHLTFASGITVEGKVTSLTRHKGRLILVTLKECHVKDAQNQTLFDPSWGTFDMGVGTRVISVFGGPADRQAFGETTDFVAQRVPKKQYTESELKLHNFYQEIRDLRQSQEPDTERLSQLAQKATLDYSQQWLMALEILELAYAWDHDKVKTQMQDHLNQLAQEDFHVASVIQDGLRLADKQL